MLDPITVDYIPRYMSLFDGRSLAYGDYASLSEFKDLDSYGVRFSVYDPAIPIVKRDSICLIGMFRSIDSGLFSLIVSNMDQKSGILQVFNNRDYTIPVLDDVLKCAFTRFNLLTERSYLDNRAAFLARTNEMLNTLFLKFEDPTLNPSCEGRVNPNDNPNYFADF